MIKKEIFTIPGAKGRNMLMDLTYDDQNPKAPLVIFAHGFKGFKDWGTHNMVARLFVENGFRYLKFNFSHNGTTPDKPLDFADLIAFSDNTFSIELEDLKAVIDFAFGGSSMRAADNVYLIGHSMGGGVGIIKTAEDKRISKLVTMASISSFRNLWPKQAEEQWKMQGIMYVHNARTGQQMPLKSTLLDDLNAHPSRLSITEKAAAVQQPWLIVHGDADTSVPVSHAEELKAAQPNAELIIIPKADHTFNSKHPYDQDILPVALEKFCLKAMEFFSTKI
jgi:pimeloyl-ACP methyl ester carboxylesterase